MTYHFNFVVNSVKVLQFSKTDFEVYVGDFFCPHAGRIMDVLWWIIMDHGHEHQWRGRGELNKRPYLVSKSPGILRL